MLCQGAGGTRGTHEHTHPMHAHISLGGAEAAKGPWEGGSRHRRNFGRGALPPLPPCGGSPA